jgi:RNA polymerase sigma factor (TIGR02999 family)
MRDVSTLLKSARDGADGSANQVFEILYEELRTLAHRQLRGSGDSGPLNTTTLVHESYLRLLNAGALKAEDRRHFLAYACTVMRSVVVDFARRQLAEKRGGGRAAITLDTAIANSATASDEDVLRVHDALAQLASMDERLAKIVEMRYFAGMTEDETAETLDVSTRTIQREWEKARMYLAAELTHA